MPNPLGSLYPPQKLLSQESAGFAKIPKQSILVSVRSAEEFGLAAEAGVHWIDIKEPNLGSLGCPSELQVRAILVAAASQLASKSVSTPTPFRLSLALGDVEDSQDLPIEAYCLDAFEMVKVGVKDRSKPTSYKSMLKRWQSASGVPDRFVLVYYPDATAQADDDFENFLDVAGQLQIHRILIDTLHKNGKSTLDHLQATGLKRLIQQASFQKIEVMVAGALKLDDLATAFDCGAKIIGIRSAVCFTNSRLLGLDTDKLKSLANLWC